jgi:hypothetical protein
MTAYVDLVCAEIRATNRLNQQPLQTVSFGGGVSFHSCTCQHLQFISRPCSTSSMHRMIPAQQS